MMKLIVPNYVTLREQLFGGLTRKILMRLNIVSTSVKRMAFLVLQNLSVYIFLKTMGLTKSIVNLLINQVYDSFICRKWYIIYIRRLSAHSTAW